jgi:hypothetical protein
MLTIDIDPLDCVHAPKLRNRFKLIIQHADGSPAPEFDFLAQMVIAFDLSSELLVHPGDNMMPLVDEYIHRTGRAVIWVEDDVTCGVMKTIRTWQAAPQHLKLILVAFNSQEEVLEAYTFTNVLLDALQHSLWSYSDVSDRLSLKVKAESKTVADITGELYASTTRSTSMKLLQVSFKGFHHSIATEPVKVTDLFK